MPNPSPYSLDHWFLEILIDSIHQKHWRWKTLLYRLLVELFSLLFTEIFSGELEWRLLIFLFKKIAKLLVLQQVIFPVTTLLHYFCPLVQGLLLVCIHDGGLLFKTEITRVIIVYSYIVMSNDASDSDGVVCLCLYKT